MKLICFRFDVDTHKCAKVGVPNLVRLAKEKSVHFTFFVNTGKSISLRHSLIAKVTAISNPNLEGANVRLGALRKLGCIDYLKCAILNPNILEYAFRELQEAAQLGHELGLHGGQNHEIWGRCAKGWDTQYLRSQVEWGLKRLMRLGVQPQGFASPFAVTPNGLEQILIDLSFQYFSDNLIPDAQQLSDGPLPDLPTSLVGEGGVAYIEQLVAKGLSDEQICTQFKHDLAGKEWAVFYDHPYFAGVEKIALMSKIIQIAIDQGFEIVTCREMVRKLYPERALRTII